MQERLEAIEQAIEFISADRGGDSKAYLSLATGEIYMLSEYWDEAVLIPDDIDDASKYLLLPQKNELNLGHGLVFGFIEDYAFEAYPEIRAMFKKRGAYRRYSEWLERHNLLDAWYRYRDETTTRKIVAWCKDNDVSVCELPM